MKDIFFICIRHFKIKFITYYTQLFDLQLIVFFCRMWFSLMIVVMFLAPNDGRQVLSFVKFYVVYLSYVCDVSCTE